MNVEYGRTNKKKLRDDVASTNNLRNREYKLSLPTIVTSVPRTLGAYVVDRKAIPVLRLLLY